MPAIVAVLLGLVVVVLAVKLALGLVVLAVGLSLALAVYFGAEKLVGKGR